MHINTVSPQKHPSFIPVLAAPAASRQHDGPQSPKQKATFTQSFIQLIIWHLKVTIQFLIISLCNSSKGSAATWLRDEFVPHNRCWGVTLHPMYMGLLQCTILCLLSPDVAFPPTWSLPSHRHTSASQKQLQSHSRKLDPLLCSETTGNHCCSWGNRTN